MTSTPTSGVDEGRIEKLRVAALTMARDEADMLPRWVDYYGRHFGLENLVVIDDNSVDGSTENLPCASYRMPSPPWKSSWGVARRKLVSGFARGLLAIYDVVVFTDVDEFLVPDPVRYSGLVHYLSTRTDRSVIAPLGLNVLHHPRLEATFDHSRPVLQQRRFVKFAPGMCKPLIKRSPAEWSAGFHGIKKPFAIDRDLLLLHLKYYDVPRLAAVSEQRQSGFEHEGRGGAASSWAMGKDELTSRLLSWVETPAGQDIPEFDPNEPDLSDVVRPSRPGVLRSRGSQLKAMENNPLRQLSPAFRNVL